MGYVVRYKSSDEAEPQQVFLAGARQTQWQLNGVHTPDSYSFEVATVDKSGILSTFREVH